MNPTKPTATAFSLRAQQEWFADAVTAAPPLHDELARVLTSSSRATAAARLDVYRSGYLARLVECLADDYPAVQHLLGVDAFASLAHDYIAAHPSRSPSLNAFGRLVPDLLASRAVASRDEEPTAFAADLARLEWALVEAVHAAPSPTLALDRFAHMTPDQWAVARLVPATATRFLRFAFPVNRYYQAFRADAPPTPLGAEASAVLIHRPAWAIWRTDLTVPMTQLLEAILGGVPLGEALATAIESDDDAAHASVTRWFQDWVGGGVFTAVELPEG